MIFFHLKREKNILQEMKKKMTTLRMKEDRAELLGGQRHEIIGCKKRDSNLFTDWLVDDREN